MLPKQYRLKKKKDFKLVFEKGKTFNNKFLFLKGAKNALKNSRFAFIVSLKISKKAVVRNRIKRLLREAIREKLDDIKSGFDVVIIAKPEIVNKNYREINKEIEGLLKKAELIQVINS